MPNRPNILRDRVVKAAIQVSDCVAEFGNEPDGLKCCSEHFQELDTAVAELNRFANNVFTIRSKLDAIQLASDTYGQPDRSRIIKMLIGEINSIINSWDQDAG